MFLFFFANNTHIAIRNSPPATTHNINTGKDSPAFRALLLPVLPPELSSSSIELEGSPLGVADVTVYGAVLGLVLGRTKGCDGVVVVVVGVLSAEEGADPLVVAGEDDHVEGESEGRPIIVGKEPTEDGGAVIELGLEIEGPEVERIDGITEGAY